MKVHCAPNKRRNKFEGSAEYCSLDERRRRGHGAFPSAMPSPSTHLRAPLLWLLFPFMAGLTAAKLWPAPTIGLTAIALVAAFLAAMATWLAICPGRGKQLGWAFCLGSAISLGGFVTIHFREPQLHQWENQPPREITLSLRVDQIYPGSPQARSVSGLGEIVAAGENDGELKGRRVYFSALRKFSAPPHRSAIYVFRGIIEPLPREPAEASFNDYLENLGIRQKLTRARIVSEVAQPTRFRQFCNRTATRLERILVHGLERHPEISSLYLAMLLGEKAVLSPDQQNAFMRSGTFHIFSISGLHVGVIALALHSILLLLRIPRRAAVFLTLSILWFYLEVTGINSPAVRSFLMIAFLLGSKAFSLPGNPLAALAAAALTTLLIDPLQLFSAGFQMSYAVVTALVVMGLPLTEKIVARWHPFSVLPRPNWRWYHRGINWFGRNFLSSCCAGWVAFLASAPSGIGYFHLFSPGSLLANLIIVPLSSAAIVSGFISLVTGLMGLLSLSALFNSSAAMIILLMDWLAEHGTQLPGVYFDARFTHSWFAAASVIAMTICLFAGLSARWSKRVGGYWAPVVLLALILIFGVKFG
jgi:competence protein ComEC